MSDAVERRGRRTSRRRELRKPAFEVGDKVVAVLEADVQAHCRAARLPFRGTPQLRAVEGYRQTLEAAPGGADTKEVERLDEGGNSFGGIIRLQDETEEARGALEVALPDCMARVVVERGMQHA